MWLAKQVWFLIYQVKYFRCCCCCCCVRYCNCRFSMKIQRVYIVSACARQCFPICFTFLQRDNNRLMERWQNAFAFIQRFHLEKSPWKAFADKGWSWWENICLFLTFKLTDRIHSNHSWLHIVEEGTQAACRHPAARRLWTALLNIFLPKPVGGKGRWWGPAWKAFRSVFMRIFHRLLKQLLRAAASTLMSLADATV